MDAKGITHRAVEANGLSMHVAEKGEGPVVLLLHGFPELWYSWRHQILGLAARGYRAIAPDLRGYGDTSAPPAIASYSVFHIIGDLIALLDALDIPEVVGEKKMDAKGITHRAVEANGISMHVAEKGEGPVVLLLHGFPELWYSWRHQILGLAARGYRAIAPDLRGYGDTSAPPAIASYSVFHIIGDLIALLDALDIPEVFLVGHDWGALVAWHMCMLRPDRVKALVNLSVPFMPRNPAVKLVEHFRSLYGDDFYICKFQKPGEIEEAFARVGTRKILQRFLSYHDPQPPILRAEDFLEPKEGTLPSWLTEEDIDYFTSKFEKCGFTGPVNYYRDWELGAIWSGVQIKVPVKFIVGDQDLTYHFHGIQDYIHNGGFKRDVPMLEEVIVMEGVGHFINQEEAHAITEHIYGFIQRF